MGGPERLAGPRKRRSRGEQVRDGRAQVGRGGEREKDPKEFLWGKSQLGLFPIWQQRKVRVEAAWGGSDPLDGLRDAQPELCPGTTSWWGQVGQKSSLSAPPEWDPFQAFRVSSRAWSLLVIFPLAPSPCGASFLPS